MHETVATLYGMFICMFGKLVFGLINLSNIINIETTQPERAIENVVVVIGVATSIDFCFHLVSFLCFNMCNKSSAKCLNLQLMLTYNNEIKSNQRQLR